MSIIPLRKEAALCPSSRIDSSRKMSSSWADVSSGRRVFLVIGNLINVFVAAAIILLPDAFTEISFVRICFAMSIGFVAVVLWQHKNNVLLFSRTLLLLLPGYAAAAIQICNPELYYSYYGRASQTLDISVLLYALTNFALAGSEIGSYLGAGIPAERSDANPLVDDIYFFFPIVPLLLLSYYVALVYGATLFEASYASGGGMSGLGSAGAIGVTLAFCMFGHCMASRSTPKLLILGGCLLALLVYGMLLRGGRQDSISCLFGLYVLYWAFRGRPAPISGWTMVCAIPLIIFMEYFGFLRSNVLTADFDYIDSFWQFVQFYSHPAETVNLSTTGAISSTFASTIYGVKTGLTGFLHGRTYLDYILRTPPEFLYPNRPRDYAWIFQDWNMTSGGGFFELAEAYLNFGVLGVFFIPMAISFYISRTFHRFLARKTLLSCFALFGILSMFLRGALYQTFAFYRAQLVALTVMGVFALLNAVLRERKRNVRDIRIS